MPRSDESVAPEQLEGTRGELERREQSLREEHRNTASYLGLLQVMPESDGLRELIRRVEGELEALGRELATVREALRRPPPPAPTQS